MLKKSPAASEVSSAAATNNAEDIFVSFAPGWDESQWQPVRSARWEISAKWKQEADCISNIIYGDPDSEYTEPARGSDYASLLYKKQLSGDLRMETVCLFQERMAPLLVISKEIGPVYGEHIEVVLFDLGVNVWHHFIKPDGKPDWKLIGFLALPQLLEPGKKHKLVAEIHSSPRGNFVCVGIDAPAAGIALPQNWGKTFYAGITACEGHNSFYSFRITGKDKSGPIPEMLS